MKKTGDDIFRLKSGREFYANCHIIGIGKDDYDKDGDGEIFITEGYDGGLFFKDPPLTIDERAEIADYAIGLWERFKKGGSLV